jgi:hypothetical protein
MLITSDSTSWRRKHLREHLRENMLQEQIRNHDGVEIRDTQINLKSYVYECL